MACAAGRQETTIPQEGVCTAEKIERAAIGSKERLRMEKVVWRGGVRIPNYAGVNSPGHAAKIGSCKAYGAAARTGEEQDFTLRKQGGMNRQNSGVEGQNFPICHHAPDLRPKVSSDNNRHSGRRGYRPLGLAWPVCHSLLWWQHHHLGFPMRTKREHRAISSIAGRFR